jgi:hypothetical protein
MTDEPLPFIETFPLSKVAKFQSPLALSVFSM